MPKVSAADIEEFKRYQEFKAQQQNGIPALGTVDQPKPTIVEVLTALVHSARLPSEQHARDYIDAIHDHFDEKDEEPDDEDDEDDYEGEDEIDEPETTPESTGRKVTLK